MDHQLIRALFDTTIGAEWRALVGPVGMTRDEVQRIGRNTIEAAVLVDGARVALLAEYDAVALRTAGSGGAA